MTSLTTAVKNAEGNLDNFVEESEFLITRGTETLEHALVDFARHYVAPVVKKTLCLSTRQRFDPETFEVFEVLSYEGEEEDGSTDCSTGDDATSVVMDVQEGIAAVGSRGLLIPEYEVVYPDPDDESREADPDEIQLNFTGNFSYNTIFSGPTPYLRQLGIESGSQSAYPSSVSAESSYTRGSASYSYSYSEYDEYDDYSDLNGLSFEPIMSQTVSESLDCSSRGEWYENNDQMWGVEAEKTSVINSPPQQEHQMDENADRYDGNHRHQKPTPSLTENSTLVEAEKTKPADPAKQKKVMKNLKKLRKKRIHVRKHRVPISKNVPNLVENDTDMNTVITNATCDKYNKAKEAAAKKKKLGWSYTLPIIQENENVELKNISLYDTFSMSRSEGSKDEWEKMVDTRDDVNNVPRLQTAAFGYACLSELKAHLSNGDDNTAITTSDMSTVVSAATGATGPILMGKKSTDMSTLQCKSGCNNSSDMLLSTIESASTQELSKLPRVSEESAVVDAPFLKNNSSDGYPDESVIMSVGTVTVASTCVQSMAVIEEGSREDLGVQPSESSGIVSSANQSSVISKNATGLSELLISDDTNLPPSDNNKALSELEPDEGNDNSSRSADPAGSSCEYSALKSNTSKESILQITVSNSLSQCDEAFTAVEIGLVDPVVSRVNNAETGENEECVELNVKSTSNNGDSSRRTSESEVSSNNESRSDASPRKRNKRRESREKSSGEEKSSVSTPSNTTPRGRSKSRTRGRSNRSDSSSKSSSRSGLPSSPLMSTRSATKKKSTKGGSSTRAPLSPLGSSPGARKAASLLTPTKKSGILKSPLGSTPTSSSRRKPPTSPRVNVNIPSPSGADRDRSASKKTTTIASPKGGGGGMSVRSVKSTKSSKTTKSLRSTKSGKSVRSGKSGRVVARNGLG